MIPSYFNHIDYKNFYLKECILSWKKLIQKFNLQIIKKYIKL